MWSSRFGSGDRERKDAIEGVDEVEENWRVEGGEEGELKRFRGDGGGSDASACRAGSSDLSAPPGSLFDAYIAETTTEFP